jgi:hypothetical protein
MDQQDVIAFLSDGASYGKPGIAVDRIDTHISIVFLIADRAYKLKRAVSFFYWIIPRLPCAKNSARRNSTSIDELPRPFTFASAPSDAERMAIFFSMTAPSLFG